MNRIPFPACRRSAGFSLIEVLISVLILALGLLTVLALMFRSIQFSSSSNYRTIATQQANAMAEVLRSNPSMLPSFEAADLSAAVADANCLAAAGCASTAAWATTTLVNWRDGLATILPSGSGYVCRDNAADNLAVDAVPPSGATAANWGCTLTANDANAPFVVKVCWNENRAAIGAFAGGVMCTWATL